jgi:hypothetical protein
MSIHYASCCVCLKRTNCNDDSYVLTVLDSLCDADIEYGHPLAFCSPECFLMLLESIGERLKISLQIHPEWEPVLSRVRLSIEAT